MIEYYLNKIFNRDCVEFLPKLPSNCIDLIVTSPPYDELRTYEDTLVWNDTIWKPILKQCYRVLKPGGVLNWIVGDMVRNGSETLTSSKQKIFAREECGFNIHDTMIYEKNSFVFPDPVRYWQTFEYLFVFSKGKPKTVNLIKDRKNKWAGENIAGTERQPDGSLTYSSGSKKKTKIKGMGVRTNVWRYNVGKGHSSKEALAFEHPATFPELLAHDLIKSYSKPNDIVLDPMCGGGTTLKRAKILGRNYIGIELVDKYYKLSKERLNKLKNLF